jgi:WD40 repeat protein
MLQAHPCLLPTSGLVRVFTCGAMSAGHLLAGCNNGEVCVFDLTNKVFRTSFQTGVSHGVTALEVVDDNLIIGSGDGTVVHMRGAGAKFENVQQTRVYGSIASISLNSTNAQRGVELMVGTNSGMIYLFQAADLAGTATTISAGHFHSISSIAFMQNLDPNEKDLPPSDIFVTGSEDGSMFVWDLCDYRVRVRITEKGQPTCLRFGLYGKGGAERLPTIFSGWNDGKIRAYDAVKGLELFVIDNAHVGGVTCIDIGPYYIVTGGSDGKVRVWTWMQELIVEFAEHKKGVTGVKVDRLTQHICHSCSTDGTVLSYDIRRGNRVATHNMARRGKFSCLEQRADSEGELMTASLSGHVHSWDIDYPEARIEHMDHPEELSCMSLSRSGTLLACAGSSGFVRVYHMPSTDKGALDLIAVGQGHFGSVRDLMWSPDERQIISVSDNASLCVWNFYGVP